MIQHLHISNYALIEALRIDFSSGLTIITGETGAGKSILLGALGLIMGKRADTKTLYDEGQKCVVEAFFDISRYDLKGFFQENDLDYDAELVIRRELLPSGKSRAFVNDTPVNLKVLQQLSNALIDLHEQFDTLDIHEISFQLRMIDALARHKDLLRKYQEMYASFVENRRRLASLRERNEHASREIEFIRFQLEEFENARLEAGEQERHEEELERLTNTEDIKQALADLQQQLVEQDPSLSGQLQELARRLAQVKRFDARLEPLYERFDALVVELDDLTREIENVAEDTEHDPERIAELEKRLGLIYRLQQKHSVNSLAELLSIQADLEEKLGAFGNLGEEIDRLEKEIGKQETGLRETALLLRGNREGVIPEFEEKVRQRLAQLAMADARLEVRMNPLDEPGPTGLDDIQFLFAANLGSRLQTIRDVASGGELSRLTLVTKSLVASAIPLPSLIFDEIDAGVSGDVALKMGLILRELSNQHQVISITHSPQIASKADKHYFVYKRVISEEDRTVTEVSLLSKEERVRTIATMLSQNPPSDSAMNNARELLNFT